MRKCARVPMGTYVVRLWTPVDMVEEKLRLLWVMWFVMLGSVVRVEKWAERVVLVSSGVVRLRAEVKRALEMRTEDIDTAAREGGAGYIGRIMRYEMMR